MTGAGPLVGAGIAAFALALTVGAQAQAIYKCKGPDGRITYSGQPCAGEGAPLSAASPAPGAATASPSPAAPSAEPPAPTAIRVPLPRQCDNGAALRQVITRLDNVRTPDDLRPFLADERFRLLRCEFTRFSPAERVERDNAMRELDAGDAGRRRAAMLRVEALYDRYLTPSERAARSRSRQ
ncbi:MAG: DUF4124 domain-containing protein [Betaproteobacteria bacterium]